MPRIVYVDAKHAERGIDVQAGTTVMRAALLNGVDGIIGECGGQAMCATCHVFVEHVRGELPVVGEDEHEMLDCTAEARAENSRLGCQLTAGSDFESIMVRLPESQV